VAFDDPRVFDDAEIQVGEAVGAQSVASAVARALPRGQRREERVGLFGVARGFDRVP